MKATGFGRLDFDPAPAIRQIAAINPAALLFGTDLPSTRALRPFSPGDLDVVKRQLDAELAERALYHNAIALYRPAEHCGSGLELTPGHTEHRRLRMRIEN